MKKLLRTLKRIVLTVLGKELLLSVQKKVKIEWCGNNYGGFFVSPDHLNQNSIVYSFGIGQDVSFDSHLIEKYNTQVFGFDPTPGAITFAREIEEKNKNFHFYPYGLFHKDSQEMFYPHENKDWVCGSVLHNNKTKSDAFIVEMRRVSTLMKELKHNKIDVLKMDIEGAEYGVIDDILSTDCPIDQICIEFHHRYMKGRKAVLTKEAIRKFNKKGYSIIAVSDLGHEVTFMKVK